MSAEIAATFHKLHENLLILPNAWDAASARVVQDAGAKAIAAPKAAKPAAVPRIESLPKARKPSPPRRWEEAYWFAVSAFNR